MLQPQGLNKYYNLYIFLVKIATMYIYWFNYSLLLFLFSDHKEGCIYRGMVAVFIFNGLLPIKLKKLMRTIMDFRQLGLAEETDASVVDIEKFM